METRDYPAIARKYAADVTAGRIIAGKSIRLQCKRFLDELREARKREFPYRFDAAKASRACRFVEKMPHTKGKWARSKQTLVLEPWQIWILCCTFGWLRKSDGTRRFRVLFVIVPRKNGKSALAAPIGLYMFCADGEFGAEVYSGATNEKQAWEGFGPARLMASSCQASCGTCGDSTRESRAYATSNYRGGDHTCKMWEPFGNDHVAAFPMEEDEAKKLVCEDVYQELELAYRWRETQELEQARRDCKPIVGTVNLELCEIV